MEDREAMKLSDLFAYYFSRNIVFEKIAFKKITLNVLDWKFYI